MGMKQTPAGLVVGLIPEEEEAPAPVSKPETIETTTPVVTFEDAKGNPPHRTRKRSQK